MKKLVIMSTVALASSFMIMPSYAGIIDNDTCGAITGTKDKSIKEDIRSLTEQITVFSLIGSQGEGLKSACRLDDGETILEGQTEDYYLKFEDVYVIGTPIEGGTTKTCDLAQNGTVTVGHTDQTCAGEKCDANFSPLSTDGKFEYNGYKTGDLAYGVYYKSGATFQLCMINGRCLGKNVELTSIKNVTKKNQIGVTTSTRTKAELSLPSFKPALQCGVVEGGFDGKEVYVLNNKA